VKPAIILKGCGRMAWRESPGRGPDFSNAADRVSGSLTNAEQHYSQIAAESEVEPTVA